MYLHLGMHTVVSMNDVIGIFDMDTSTVEKNTRDYLARAEKEGDVINVSMELPKSFVVCRSPLKKSGRVVYISQISTATLLRRSEYIESISNIRAAKK